MESLLEAVTLMDAESHSITLPVVKEGCGEAEYPDLEEENFWSRTFTGARAGLRAPSFCDKVYTFLLSSTLKELRLMVRETCKRHTRLKNAVMCHCLLNGQKTVSRGDLDWDGFFQCRLERFWSSTSSVTRPIRMQQPRNKYFLSLQKKPGAKHGK